MMLRPMFRFSAPSPRAFRAPKDSTRADLLPVPDQLTARLTDRRTGRHIKSKDVLDELQSTHAIATCSQVLSIGSPMTPPEHTL
jgi:hypothetical protein